jgi:hypothetical protein
MIECLGEDKVKVLFEYDKRQTFAGVNTCFDHSRYIIQDPTTGQEREDIIPYTVLDICNKANVDRRRCYQYAYQLTFHVSCPADIYPKLFAKITLNSAKGLVILPGDQIKTSFTTSYTQQQESIRIMPEIYSPAMPEPIKSRYHFPGGLVRLPCDDRKVADQIQFQDLVVYCTEPADKINLKIQGAGDIFSIDTTCGEFMAGASPNGQQFNWAASQELLRTRSASGLANFSTSFNTGTARRKFTMTNVQVKNPKYDATTMRDWFEFEYEIGHMLHSEEKKCYQGVHMGAGIPSASLHCHGRECFLESPAAPNTHKRMLGGAETAVPAPGVFSKRFLQKLAGDDVSEPDF